MANIETIKVHLVSSQSDRSYPIYIGSGLLEQVEYILPYLRQKRVAIVTNETVAPLYLKKIKDALEHHQVSTVAIILPDGENYKNWETLNLIFDALLKQNCERKTTLIALGGGVIGDLTGFAAATYLRGIPFIQVPTTLLAQVDSSVGGKTGINHPLGKNMIGSFYQPLLVLADSSTLFTLPDREFRSGLAEVVKYGLIRDAEFFNWLEVNMSKLVARDLAVLNTAICRSCEIKAEIVAADEHESGVRSLLNLGHTFGHAIENAMGYGQWLHGEAVAAGTIVAAELSKRMGLINETEFTRIQGLFELANLPISLPAISPSHYLDLMKLDKKVEGGKMRFILLNQIGQAAIFDNIRESLLIETMLACGAND
ncbi:MAG: 3-dehydroquinate synthase [Nitrosomonas sp.]|nr:3-dehydroquinate synthase [Nitrosomonas sp.]